MEADRRGLAAEAAGGDVEDLPGVTPVQKFTSREIALQRIWRFMYAPEQTTQRKEKESRVGSRFGKARKRPRCMPCCAVRKEQRLARSGN
jgi:hypothetical protein